VEVPSTDREANEVCWKGQWKAEETGPDALNETATRRQLDLELDKGGSSLLNAVESAAVQRKRVSPWPSRKST
jgi:hypothetical protein